MSKTYTYAGWSLHNDEWRLRFANHHSRAGHLRRVGHQHVMLVPLPEAMTAEQAAIHMFSNAELMAKAEWRRQDEGLEDTPLLSQANERIWYMEHWLSTHPEA